MCGQCVQGRTFGGSVRCWPGEMQQMCRDHLSTSSPPPSNIYPIYLFWAIHSCISLKGNTRQLIPGGISRTSSSKLAKLFWQMTLLPKSTLCWHDLSWLLLLQASPPPLKLGYFLSPHRYM